LSLGGLQIRQHRGQVRVAVARFPGQGFGQHRTPPSWDPLRQDQRLEVFHHDPWGGLAIKQLFSGQRFRQHAGQAVLVNSRGDSLFIPHLRRHVARCPGRRGHHGRGGRALGLGCPGKSKVGDQHIAQTIEENVIGLDVAVRHALAMGILQSGNELPGDRENFAFR